MFAIKKDFHITFAKFVLFVNSVLDSVLLFSGNQMGDEGARILAKALQINSKLR